MTNPDPDRPSDDWIEDPRSDLDRILRQQYFLRSLGQTALNRSAGNPFTAFALANAVVVEPVEGPDPHEARSSKSLVRTFRGLDPATVEMTTLPVDGRHERQSARREVSRSAAGARPAEELHARRRSCSPQAADPSNVKVVVVDGSGVEGRAAPGRARRSSRAASSRGGSADASSTEFAKTQVRYALGQGDEGPHASREYLGTGERRRGRGHERAGREPNAATATCSSSSDATTRTCEGLLAKPPASSTTTSPASSTVRDDSGPTSTYVEHDDHDLGRSRRIRATSRYSGERARARSSAARSLAAGAGGARKLRCRVGRVMPPP